MLRALNTKILLAIVAALTVIGGAVLYQRDQTQKAAAAAAKQPRFSRFNRTTRSTRGRKTKLFGRRSKPIRSGIFCRSPRRQDLEDVHPLIPQ